MIATTFIFVFWLIFIVYWAISAVGVKRDIKMKPNWTEYIVRLVAFLLLIWILVTQPALLNWGQAFFLNPWTQWIGVIFCGIGIVFTIWARMHLGKNWSGIPKLKENHELVIMGPYRFVRHPIYTGVILALIGSALAGGIAWVLICLVFSVMFIGRVSVEEKLMQHQFPNQYPEYKKRTKALIPFIF